MKVSKITGYRSNSPIVCIFRDNKPFYAKKNKGNGISFNMPLGEYDILAGDLIPLNEPLKYTLFKMPYPKERVNFPGKMKFYFIDNPNKCSVDLNGKYVTKIYFDKSFLNEPWYELIWIVGHETGHYFYHGGKFGTDEYYKNESLCDHFSANIMLMNGYNPSQIDAAIEWSISNNFHSRKRKNDLYQNLVKIKTIE